MARRREAPVVGFVEIAACYDRARPLCDGDAARDAPDAKPEVALRLTDSEVAIMTKLPADKQRAYSQLRLARHAAAQRSKLSGARVAARNAARNARVRGGR